MPFVFADKIILRHWRKLAREAPSIKKGNALKSVPFAFNTVNPENLFPGGLQQFCYRFVQVPAHGIFIGAFFIFALAVFHGAAADYQAVRQAD